MFKIIDKINQFIDSNQKISFWGFGWLGFLTIFLLIPYASVMETPSLMALGFLIGLFTLYVHSRIFENAWADEEESQ